MDKGHKPKKSSSKGVIDAKAYREGLGPVEKARYLRKLDLIGGADPYLLASSSSIWNYYDFASWAISNVKKLGRGAGCRELSGVSQNNKKQVREPHAEAKKRD